MSLKQLDNETGYFNNKLDTDKFLKQPGVFEESDMNVETLARIQHCTN